jgi:hypothetical protein
MKRRQFLATTIAFGASAFTRAADEPLPRDGKNLSFRNEIRDSLNRSLVWLRAQQNADGSFGKDTLHPALTALPLIAFQREPTGRFAKEEFVAKGYAYLRSFTQPDGGIYSKENGLANYNTAVCLLALVGANEPKDLDTLVKARAYVVGQQANGMAKPETDGGIGYGSIGASPKRGHPDLDNTVVALEALRATKHLIADKPGTKDLNWNAAIDFVARCQNLPSNKQPWASADADNKGGFIYYPGFSNAGEVTLEGAPQLRLDELRGPAQLHLRRCEKRRPARDRRRRVAPQALHARRKSRPRKVGLLLLPAPHGQGPHRRGNHGTRSRRKEIRLAPRARRTPHETATAGRLLAERHRTLEGKQSRARDHLLRAHARDPLRTVVAADGRRRALAGR